MNNDVEIRYGYWGTGVSLYVIRRRGRRGAAPVGARTAKSRSVARRGMSEYGQGPTFKDARIIDATGPKPVVVETLVVSA